MNKQVKHTADVLASLIGQSLEEYFKMDYSPCADCEAYKYKRPNKNGCGCCGGCAETKGYYGEHMFEVIADKFGYSKKDGFWVPGYGCKIPRRWRSKTCQAHVCGSLQVALGMTSRDIDTLHEVCQFLYELNSFLVHPVKLPIRKRRPRPMPNTVFCLGGL